MTDIFGLNSYGSSPSAVLQSSLESRLRATLEEHGSMEYGLTWKLWPMRSGAPICALRASGRRTSGSAFTGWPTPDASAMNVSADPEKHMERLRLLKIKHNNGNGAGLTLGIACHLSGWASPAARDWKSGRGKKSNEEQYGTKGKQLAREAVGVILEPSDALTEKRGALDPEFVRWLMGFPPAWGSCAPTAMPSSRKSRQPSSKPT